MQKSSIAILSALFVFLACTETPVTDNLTRGIGVYPGDTDEYFGPIQKIGDDSYRNLAFLRNVHHSSSFDYNLTGQLVTDGIVMDNCPYYMDVISSDGPIAKREREKVFDDNMTSFNVKGGKDAFLTFNFYNGKVTADEVEFTGSVNCNPDNERGYDIIIEATEDGDNWQILGEFKGSDLPGKPRAIRRPAPAAGSQNVAVSAGLGNGSSAVKTKQPAPTQMTAEMQARIRQMNNMRTFSFSANIPAGKSFTSFRIKLSSVAVKEWRFQETNFIKKGEEIKIIPSFSFYSAWMSEGNKDEWLYVDLGATSEFDNIKLFWIQKPDSGVIEVSDNLTDWTKISDLSQEDDFNLSGKGRYVRLSELTREDGSSIILSEMQIFGRGGVTFEECPQKEIEGNRLYLNGGKWRLQRASEVTATGEDISQTGFDDKNWIIATVPATVASSYYNIGAIPDIRYDDDQLQISESFFYSDFWYRDEFDLPEEFKGKEIILNFDGINWKADVYFNGRFVGHIDGAFTRGHFNVTDLAKEGTNNIAVLIYKNANPGIIKEQNRITADTNGGVLGADNPTMHCSIGWDWIPTVRGRNIGIWNDVWVGAYEGGITIDDVFVETGLPLPSVEYADIKPTVTLTNRSSSAKTAEIKLTYGNLILDESVKLEAGETRDFEMIPGRISNPELWWPANYGDQYLYDVYTTVSVDGNISDTKVQKSGIRKITYSTDNGVLDIFVNGRRLICNGGNWGFPEINLNYRGREYDIAVAYHADMNFTMIRDWVGQTGDEEFYEACDRHGVMIWQDFWLANPSDGPNPDDNAMFMANAEDYVRKVRNHPSIALYVGRNEGNPPEELNNGLEKLVKRLHPEIYYIPHSAAGMVSGNGPYRALPVQEYFAAERGKDRLHSERGMPNVMTYESMMQMLRPENQWPQTSVWGVHDYTMENAQSCATFNEMIEKAFGESNSLKQFTEYAQWINYNGYRALYESRSWNRKGLLIWMSHSCWPSMVWQTYDYYFEPTAAYFGAKKGSAPIRIQWNPISGNVEVVNNNAMNQNGLKAYAYIINYDGKIVYENSFELDSPEDTTVPVFPLSFDIPELSDTYFIKLQLKKGEELLADNFYWEGKEDGNYQELLKLGEARISMSRKIECENGNYTIHASVKNKSNIPALMLRLKVQGRKTGERILPVFYEDNYFSLLPGEEKTVEITFKKEDAHGENPALSIEGFNTKCILK